MGLQSELESTLEELDYTKNELVEKDRVLKDRENLLENMVSCSLNLHDFSQTLTQIYRPLRLGNSPTFSTKNVPAGKPRGQRTKFSKALTNTPTVITPNSNHNTLSSRRRVARTPRQSTISNNSTATSLPNATTCSCRSGCASALSVAPTGRTGTVSSQPTLIMSVASKAWTQPSLARSQGSKRTC